MTSKLFLDRTTRANLSEVRHLRNKLTNSMSREGDQQDVDTSKDRDKSFCFPELMWWQYVALGTNEKFNCQTHTCPSVDLQRHLHTAGQVDESERQVEMSMCRVRHQSHDWEIYPDTLCDGQLQDQGNSDIVSSCESRGCLPQPHCSVVWQDRQQGCHDSNWQASCVCLKIRKNSWVEILDKNNDPPSVWIEMWIDVPVNMTNVSYTRPPLSDWFYYLTKKSTHRGSRNKR